MVWSRFYDVYAVLHPMARYVSKPPISAAFAGFSASSADIQVPLKSQGLAQVRPDRQQGHWQKSKPREHENWQAKKPSYPAWPAAMPRRCSIWRAMATRLTR